jgi:lantibiotic modifying enzyme
VKSDLKNILEYIYIESDNSALAPSLFVGEAGIALFRILYLKHFKNSAYDPKTIASIQAITESLITIADSSFCYGSSGIKWLFSYLYKLDIIEKDDYENISLDDNITAANALKLLDSNNYEFLSGAVGIAHYILSSNYKFRASFFAKFFKKLNTLIDNEDCIIHYFDFEKQYIDPTRVNWGLAHGIIGVLKLCLECFQLDICKKEAMEMSQKIIDFLCKKSNPPGALSVFPSITNTGFNGGESRLGWCYGDLITGYALYRAASLFNDDRLLIFANEVLTKTSSRRLSEETGVQDVSMCHGSIGIAHIYNKLWLHTNNPLFKETGQFWIDQSIKTEPYLNGENSQMKFNIFSKRYESNLSLLEGSAGFGLVLLSYLTGDYSWDYCLMLN